MADFELGGIAAGHVQAGAERRHHVDAGLAGQFIGYLRKALAVAALTT